MYINRKWMSYVQYLLHVAYFTGEEFSYLGCNKKKKECFILDLAPETPLLFPALLNLELVL